MCSSWIRHLSQSSDSRLDGSQSSVITGEEADETLFSARSKLFVMENDNYREAGTGSMRVNKSLTASKPSYRLRQSRLDPHA